VSWKGEDIPPLEPESTFVLGFMLITLALACLAVPWLL
jgi:hydrogenase/urease accessory protein HupE